MSNIEIRVLGPATAVSAGIEDHYAHLLRLDPQERALSLADDGDRGIDGHCLRLMAAQAILIGGYVGGILRASIEVVPSRTCRQGKAVFTAEPGFHRQALTRMLLARMFEEARRYRMSELRLAGLDDAATLANAAADSGVIVEAGATARLILTPPVATSSPRAMEAAAG